MMTTTTEAPIGFVICHEALAGLVDPAFPSSRMRAFNSSLSQDGRGRRLGHLPSHIGLAVAEAPVGARTADHHHFSNGLRRQEPHELLPSVEHQEGWSLGLV